MTASTEQKEAASQDGKISVKEGLAYILVPKDATNQMDPKKHKDDPTQVQSVFYNPIQQFNRDLSVLAIKAFGEDLLAERRKQGEATFKRKQRMKAAQARHKANRQSNGGPIHNSGPVSGQEALEEASADVDNITAEAPPKKRVKIEHQTDDGTGRDETVNSEPIADAKQDLGSALPTPKWNARFTILDALSATGLRALRYAKEIPFSSSITANDLLPDATKQITSNARYNGVESKIRVVTGNALSHMYSFAGDSTQAVSGNAGKYDVIDLDPYGTAVPFLDAALHAINDGGLLCVTCTDAGVWASNGYPEKAFALYGGTPMKGLHSHEAGLRLILHAIATAAARQGISIEPLLSLSIDYYARTFVRIRRSQAEVKFLAGKTMVVYNCDAGCGAWTTQFIGRNDLQQPNRSGKTFYKHTFAQGPSAAPYCEHCGLKTHLGGPMYGGPLHNPAFVKTILQTLPDLDSDTYHTKDRIRGMLTTALEEIILLDPQADNSSGSVEADEKPLVKTSDDTSNSQPPQRSIPRLDPAAPEHHPFFVVPSALAKVLHCQAPSEAAVKGALLHAGYCVARSHTKPGTVKTTAPWGFVWRLMREWVRQRAPVKEGAVRPGTAGYKILGLGPAESEARERDRQQRDSEAIESKEVVFDEALGRQGGQQQQKLVRYQVNPRENWGPMGRARGGGGGGGGKGSKTSKGDDDDEADAAQA